MHDTELETQRPYDLPLADLLGPQRLILAEFCANGAVANYSTDWARDIEE